MNDWKWAITLASCCCIVLTIAASASADFLGVTTVIKDDPDTEFLCTEGIGPNVIAAGFGGGLTVCNVFAVFDDPSDRLLSAAADLQVWGELAQIGRTTMVRPLVVPHSGRVGRGL